ncbi:hypothetical protein FJZ40_00545 [Candidatus Shapirobacteria bacterium]|nr:hypothetical protein [Candidatus Shapirobacteria bacterium]
MDKSLSILVRSSEKIFFSGQANALSSRNDKGAFDVLPEHANFISLIKEALVIYTGPIRKIFPLKMGVLKVCNNKVSVFVQSENSALTLGQKVEEKT